METANDELLDVHGVAALLKRSVTSIYRDADRGILPWGKKFSGARRWSKQEILEWILGGCKPVRRNGGAR